MEPVLDWEQRYRESTTAWERDKLNPAFEQWQADFSEAPGRVILPGCGRAAEVIAFAQLGWQVTGIDLAETAIDYQRNALHEAGLEGELMASNLFDWQPPCPADLVYEQTCLCALHPDQWPAYEQQLLRWLKPGGRLAALFMQAERDAQGPPFHCDLESMHAIFSADRWQWGDRAVRAEHPLGFYELGVLLTRL